MTTCKECKFYNAADETSGNCFGHKVLADTPADQCPTKSFTPK
ncbi:MAG TPA: hypothetical protein VK436_05070 [Methanocella sp.]|nr:hypothetical protein [Methanocella sp.]